MCGIAGVAGAGGPAEVERVARALDLLRHRGPDGAGVAAVGAAVFGHRRLAIHDLTAAGAQPFVDDARPRMSVVNGQFFDHADLRREVVRLGARLKGGSDSELLLPLFAESGAAIFERLRGPFAAAVYDEPSRTLSLARDRFGKKPLHYALVDGAMWFASEAGALARTLGRKPRRDVLVEFLRLGYVLPPRTAFEGISALGPAETLEWTVGDAAPRIRRWWTPPFPDGKRSKSEAEPSLLLESLLEESVRLRLTGERPIGLLLSGGMDSTAVAALAAGISRSPLVAFTGSMDVPAFDESSAAAKTAARLGLAHRVVRCEIGAAERLRRLVATTGDLLGDSSILALAAVVEGARDEATVLLAGDGGDEILIGYDRQRAAAFRSVLLRVAGLWGRVPGARTSPRIAKAAAAAGLPPRLAYAEMSALSTRAELAARLTPEAIPTDDPLGALFSREPETSDLIADLARLDVIGYLPHDLMTKADRASMSAGVEIRSPFLDPPTAQAMLRLPGAARATKDRGKLPLRAMLVRRGFGDVVEKRKRGFGVPLASWLTAGPLASLAREALGDVTEPFRGVLRGGSALPILEDVRRGAPSAHLAFACVVAAIHHAEFA